MAVEWLNFERKNSSTKRVWSRWLAEVPAIRSDFLHFVKDHDIFDYNETAAAGILAAAATRAGFVSLAEYVCRKKMQTDRRKRVNGRADLWILDQRERRTWSFEFKYLTRSNGYKIDVLEDKMQQAINDASCIIEGEADCAYGALLVSANHDTEFSERYLGILNEFAKQVDYAAKIEGGKNPLFFFATRS